MQTVFEKKFAYHSYVSKILVALFPEMLVNIINAGASGNSARDGPERLERDVLSFNPDLTVVCFGLNDCSDKELIAVAEEKCALQCGGIADRFIDAARSAAKELDVKVCDVYAKRKTLAENGVNATVLLSNKINHLTRDMKLLFAYPIVETMMK